MFTRVRLLSVIVAMMVVLGSCTMVQTPTLSRVVDSPVAASPTAGADSATTESGATVARLEAAQDLSRAFFAIRLAEDKRLEVARLARIDHRRAAMAAADARAKIRKQNEINAALRYLAAKAEAEAAAADPYGYKRVEHVLTDAELKRLRDCESTDRYYITNPSGKYRGAYQFDLPTWDGVAARWFPHLIGVDPIVAPPEAQDAMTRALWSERGRQPWPECGLRV